MGSDPRVAAYEAARDAFHGAAYAAVDQDRIEAACAAFLAALLAQDDTRAALEQAFAWADHYDLESLVNAAVGVLSGFSQKAEVEK